MDESKITKRDYRIDLLKVISIFSVVLIHVNSTFVMNNEIMSKTWIYGVIIRCMTLFCVCIFYMCSGILLYNRNKPYKMNYLFKTKVFKLIFVLIIWDFIYKNVDWYVNGANINEYFGYLFEIFKMNNKYHLYYIYRAIPIFLYYPIGKQILKSNNVTVYYLILMSIPVIFIRTLMFLPLTSHIEGNIYQILANGAMEATYYSIFGYILYKNYDKNLKNNYDKIKAIKIYGILSLITCIVLIMGLSTMKNENDMNFVSACTIFGTMYTISILIKGLSIDQIGEKWLKPIRIISNNTLYIYVSHVLVLEQLERMNWGDKFMDNTILKLIYPFITTFLIIILVLFGIYVYKKIKIMLLRMLIQVTPH